MREHDQPRLHTRLSLWSGLIFALAIPTASRAQGLAAQEAQISADPIELAARYVQVWETPGTKWAILSGEAAVLQAGDGLRANSAVVRLSEMPLDDGKAYQAEIYAEGEVRISGREGPPRTKLRATFRTRKQVQLNAYTPRGLSSLKEPPRDLMILRRSGFLMPEPAIGRSQPASAPPLQAAAQSQPAAAPVELLAAPQSQVPAPGATQGASPAEPANASVSPLPAASVPAAALPPASSGKAAAATVTVLPPPDLPSLEPVPPPRLPRKDPQLLPAQFEAKRSRGQPGSSNRRER